MDEANAAPSVAAAANAAPPVVVEAEAPPVAAATNAALPVGAAANAAPPVAVQVEAPLVATVANIASPVAVEVEAPLAVAAANIIAPLVTAGANSAPPVAAAALDPQVFMAARQGDSNKLKELLLLLEDVNQAQEVAGTSMTAAQDHHHISLDVDPVPDDAVGVGQQQQPASPSAVLVPLLDGNGVPVVEAQAAGTSTAAPTPQGGSGDIEQVQYENDMEAARRLGSGVTMEGDSVLHVIAACGDSEEFIRCAKMIVFAYAQGVLGAVNSNGDTPLHCAAGAGNANMMSCLLELAGTDDAKKALVRMQNQCGETALHQAVRAANNEEVCIDQLLSVDPELGCIPRDDDDAEEEGTCSPLYLAISLGELEIAGHLFRRTRGNLSYSGPHGRNVLHAAVSRGQALRMVLGWLWLKRLGRRHGDLLLKQLTSQRDNLADGSSPLHLAAALSGWPAGGFVAKWFPQAWLWSASAVWLLLDANVSTAYQPDNKGSYPVHVAALAGSLGAVGTLLDRCPDCATLRDGQGRTFLHVAAETQEHGVDRVLEYACRKAELSSILNARDNDGETALHKAVRAGNLAAFNCLFRNRQVRLDVPNKEALTPLDLSWSMLPDGSDTMFSYILNPGRVIEESLENAGAPHGGSRSDLFKRKHVARVDEDKASETYKDSTQAIGIVSVLIATVTFASAFTLPGGYRSAADGDSSSDYHHRTTAGTPVLAGVYAFDAFVVADTLAFLCSSLATFAIVYAGIPAVHHSIRQTYIQFAIVLLHTAGRSFVAAFGLGLYLVLAPVDQAAAAAVCVITFASLLCGNIEAWQYLAVLNTLRLRMGTIRIPTARVQVRDFISWALGYYWSLMIIFGLPAIFKWASK